MSCSSHEVLVHLGAGIGNVVLATPLLAALNEMGFIVDIWLTADYPQTADLLRPWGLVREVFSNPRAVPAFSRYGHIVPSLPPFYWPRFASRFSSSHNLVARPNEAMFYADEQEFYLTFARALGYPPERKPYCRLPISGSEAFGTTEQTLVLAPGCKTGEMAAKRWPFFPELAQCFDDVAVVGTSDDLQQYDGQPTRFGDQVRSWVNSLSLRQTAELLASSGAVVANDTGLAHIAAATGTLTVMIFGPTPWRALGHMPPNVRCLQRGERCEPCWHHGRLRACGGRVDCLHQIEVRTVVETLHQMGFQHQTSHSRVQQPA